jgi:hypothetical protein
MIKQVSDFINITLKGEPKRLMKKWNSKEIMFLKKQYPKIGKLACALYLKRKEGSVRFKASVLKLKQNKSSKFFKDWQNRAKNSKIGKKRPEQAKVMKNLWEIGKIISTSTEDRQRTHKDIWKRNKHPRGMLGKHHTEKVKQMLKNNLKKAWLDPQNRVNSKEYRQLLSDRAMVRQKSGLFRSGYSRGKMGTYDINGHKIFFRSLWEVNYALYLDFLIKQNEIKKWEYEADTFWFEKIKRGVRSYKPDFKIFKNNGDIEYHEVKGWMDKKSATKIKRMAIYYPQIKLIVVNEKSYKDIKSKIGKMLKFYE